VTHENDLAIRITSEWNDWRLATARLQDLRDVHWYQPKGAPRPLLHAYLAGPQSGNRVCVLRSHNVPSVYEELVRRAATSGREVNA
jgi:hypothetical protein